MIEKKIGVILPIQNDALFIHFINVKLLNTVKV